MIRRTVLLLLLFCIVKMLCNWQAFCKELRVFKPVVRRALEALEPTPRNAPPKTLDTPPKASDTPVPESRLWDAPPPAPVEPTEAAPPAREDVEAVPRTSALSPGERVESLDQLLAEIETQIAELDQQTARLDLSESDRSRLRLRRQLLLNQQDRLNAQRRRLNPTP
jgi:hypothetical protein